jgi:hypothetical protein
MLPANCGPADALADLGLVFQRLRGDADLVGLHSAGHDGVQGDVVQGFAGGGFDQLAPFFG